MSDQPVSRAEMNEIVADFNKTVSEGLQNMIRDVFRDIGAFSTQLNNIERQQTEIKDSVKSIEDSFEEKFEKLNDRVSKNEEQILHLNRLMFGDNRTANAPYIRRDIDRHESEIIGLNETVRQINGDLKGLRSVFQELNDNFGAFLNRYETDMKVIVTVTKISKRVLPSVTSTMKILLEQRWSFIIPAAAALGAAASAAIEYFKAVGLIK